MTPTKDKMVLVQMYVNGESGSASTYVPAVVLATRPKWVDVALGDMVFTFAYDMFTDDRVPEVCSSQFDHFQSRIEWEADYAEARVAVDVAAGQAPPTACSQCGRPAEAQDGLCSNVCRQAAVYDDVEIAGVDFDRNDPSHPGNGMVRCPFCKGEPGNSACGCLGVGWLRPTDYSRPKAEPPRGLVEVLATPDAIDPLMGGESDEWTSSYTEAQSRIEDEVAPDSEGRYPDCLSGCDWRGKTIHDPACPHAPKTRPYPRAAPHDLKDLP